jgi:single-strand DNA-binding protein
MAGSVNKVILVGNLGADPEVKSFANGGRIANLRLATSETWNDRQSGERKERTEWHSVVIDNENLVRVVEQFLKKGSKVYVEGQLRTRKWQDRDGNDRYTTEVYVGRFRGELTLLDRREGGGFGGGYGDDMAVERGPARAPAPQAMGGRPAFGDDLGDDEVPF